MAKVMFIAANCRSLIANRGDLIAELIARGNAVEACVPIRDYLPQVEDLGIPIHKVSLGRTGMNPLADVLSALRLGSLLKRVGPDIVFCYGAKPIAYGAFAARRAGSRLYVMITGLGHVYTTVTVRTRLARWLLSAFYRHATGLSKFVFFQNPDDRQEFLDRGLLRDSRKAIIVNGSGVNLERYQYTPWKGGAAVFLFVGRLLTEKGVREFVEASRMISHELPGSRFLVAGGHDPLLPHAVPAHELSEWIKEGIVEFLGEVKDVASLLAECSIFVLPSYREGTPRSALEAMSVGRAIITTDVPGCRETVVGGSNGLLVPSKDAGALAEAMRRLASEPEKVAEFGRAGRRLAEEKYDVRKVNLMLLQAMGIP